MWFAPVVLPIVGVLALFSHVAPHLIVKRAPHSFEMKHVKVTVLFHFVEQIYGKFFLEVSEGAKVAKFAGFYLFWPLGAEFLLVLFWVIK